MKIYTVFLVILLCSSIVIADDQDIKNHIDQRMREFKDSTVEIVDSRTSDVTTDLKVYVDAKTEEIRVELRDLVYDGIRKLLLGIIGGLVTVYAVFRFLEGLKDRKKKEYTNQLIVPNSEPRPIVDKMAKEIFDNNEDIVVNIKGKERVGMSKMVIPKYKNNYEVEDGRQ